MKGTVLASVLPTLERLTAMERIQRVAGQSRRPANG
jgi:hypothetical protein